MTVTENANRSIGPRRLVWWTTRLPKVVTVRTIANTTTIKGFKPLQVPSYAFHNQNLCKTLYTLYLQILKNIQVLQKVSIFSLFSSSVPRSKPLTQHFKHMASSSNIVKITGLSSSSKKADVQIHPKIEDFVDEPNIQDEQALAWQSQVLIPAVRPLTHAFLGPLPNPLLETDEVREIFPSYLPRQPRVFDEKPFHLEFLNNPNRVFRSAPKVDQDIYIAWLDKVQAKKGAVWKEQGIFDLIQLSRYGPKYDSTLLLAAMHFWDSSTHSLHLKCGMLSPTLLDVAAITGLKPVGDTFDPKLSNNTYGFNFDNPPFSPYIAQHHNTATAEVSDLEHLAFLTLWLSLFIFCTRSLQVAKIHIHLAIQLHERRNINLAKLILGSLYQHLDEAALELKEDASTLNFLVSGPLWLLQLWLLATFESRLDLIIPKMILKSLETRRTEGIRLAQLRSKQINVPVEETFSIYFEMFLKCDNFTISMAPFVTRTHGPTWFKREFPPSSIEDAEEVNKIWQAYLSPSILSTRLSPTKSKNSFGISRYFPSYFARQFGLCQLRPASACSHRGEFDCPETEREYQRAFEKFYYKSLRFELIKFNPRFSCTKKFHDWWLAYYGNASGNMADDDLLAKLLSASLPQTKEEQSKSLSTAAPVKKNPVKRKATKTTTKATTTKSPLKTKKIFEQESASTPFLAQIVSHKAKGQPKPPSPIAMIKPTGKQLALSSSEDTDSDDDDTPLIHRSVLDSRARKGIVIREAQEQPPAKKLKIQTSTQHQGKETKPVKTPAATIREISPVKPVSSVPATTIQIPQEPPMETTAQECAVPTFSSAMEVENIVAKQTTIVSTDRSTSNIEAEPEKETSTKGREEKSIEESVPEANLDTAMIDLVGGEEEEDAENQSSAQENSSVKDSTTSVLSDKDLSKLKKEDPLTALKLMLSLSSSSPKLIGSSSTSSFNSINQETSEGLLQQLKAKVLEGDLLEKIAHDQMECFAIKAILQKLHKSDPNQELLAFLIEFGPLFEQLSSNVAKRVNTQKHKDQVEKLYQEETHALKTSQINISAMEAQATKDEGEIAEWDTKIQRLNEEMRILQTKLSNAEYQRSLVQKRIEEASTSSKMAAEARVAIEHFENANEHETTIAQLDKELGYLETSISLNAKILDRLKASLTIL